ncbi:hypothetical protein C8R44DRAFT_885739 [Mycena epipterygia]|nr:hypothetical protein C8R44DRAFT_885739 [Mycena epipterygia]
MSGRLAKLPPDLPPTDEEDSEETGDTRAPEAHPAQIWLCLLFLHPPFASKARPDSAPKSPPTAQPRFRPDLRGGGGTRIASKPPALYCAYSANEGDNVAKLREARISYRAPTVPSCTR